MPEDTKLASHRVVVVGAGQAGFSACARLRELGFAGSVTLIGEEPVPPYQRPPLSKAYLLGDLALERLFFRPVEFYKDQDIELRTSCTVDSIDRGEKRVVLADGAGVEYDSLILATGSRPITLPDAIGGNLEGVHYVRNLADVDVMADGMQEGRRALVVGGGYIGLEAAAVARKVGLQVTLVEAADRILQRVASEETSNYFRGLHKSHGVNIREQTMLKRLVATGDSVTGAVLSDDSEIPVDLVIAGIGIRPNQELAENAGLELENGIKVDKFCRTSDPDIFAVGDCASFPYGQGRIRLESVGNAIDQARAAAEVILGGTDPYVAAPWFWSDQYDTKLQIAGLSTGYDDLITRDSGNGTVSFWYFAGDRLLAVDAMNDPRTYMVAKRLIESGKTADKALVSDPATNLKSLLR